MAVSEGRSEVVLPEQDAPAKAPPLNDSELNFCLVAPFGLRKEILLWGPECIQSYLNANETGIITSVVDLRGEEFTHGLNKRYGPDIARVLESLKVDQPTIMGDKPEAVLGVVASLGDHFLPVARDAGLFKSWLAAYRITRKSAAAIGGLAGEVEEYLLSKIRDQIRRNAGRPTVWGLSVYDSLIITVLLTVRAIRKIDPVSPIILGGGYFNASFAKRLAEGIDPALVNGVVAGRGEDVTLQLLRSYRSGIPIERNRVPGFYSKHNTGNGELHTTDETAVFLPPENHKTLNWTPVNPVVRDRIVRIMPQRGCSWGRCTFCNHTDKEQPAFEILRDDFLAKLTESIGSLSDDMTPEDQHPSAVWLDSDEIDTETLADIIRHVAAINQLPCKVQVRGWLQIKKFTEDLGRTLFECRHKVQAYLICNTESFNFDALRAMKKGHTPLQAIYAIKAVIDTGHVGHTNVFMYYPREGFRAVEEEVELVSRIEHLLCSPNADVDVRTYAASEIDEVFRNQDEFQLTARRRNGDVWLKNEFNIDLPLRHFSAFTEENRSGGLEGIVVGCYARAINSLAIVVRRHSLLRGLDPARGRLRLKAMLGRLDLTELLLGARVFGQISILYLVTRLAGKDYWRRFRFWIHIKTRSSGQRRAKSATQRDDAPSYFLLHGRVLTRNHQGWGRKENWQYSLNDDEYAVLRYLYRVRKKRHLFDRFRKSMGDSAVAKILRRQIELGSVVESHGSLLCVVNDPEYWEYEPGRWD